MFDGMEGEESVGVLLVFCACVCVCACCVFVVLLCVVALCCVFVVCVCWLNFLFVVVGGVPKLPNSLGG